MIDYIMLALLSASLFGIGNLLQKKGLEQIPILTVKKFFKNLFSTIFLLLKNKYWLSGALLGVVAWFIYVEALSLGDMIVVKPIVNLNIVIIVVLSILLLKENLRKIELPFLTFIIIGVILLSFETQVTGSTTIDIFYLIISVVVLTVIILVLSLFNSKIGKNEFILSISAGLAYGAAEIFTKWLSICGLAEVELPLKLLLYFVSPLFWSLAFFTIIGFVIKQTAISQGRACIAFPIINGLSIFIPVVTSIIIFKEEILLLIEGEIIFPFSYFRLIGITLIIFSVVVINYLIKTKKSSYDN
ncbi:MAG: EamA family transporter [Candidatus Odinarchaeia archaeon]